MTVPAPAGTRERAKKEREHSPPPCFRQTERKGQPRHHNVRHGARANYLSCPTACAPENALWTRFLIWPLFGHATRHHGIAINFAYFLFVVRVKILGHAEHNLLAAIHQYKQVAC